MTASLDFSFKLPFGTYKKAQQNCLYLIILSKDINARGATLIDFKSNKSYIATSIIRRPGKVHSYEGVIVSASSPMNDENRRRANLMTIKVREAVANSDRPWTELEQLRAIHLIRFLVWGTPSKLLVRKIRHVISEEHSYADTADGDVVRISYVETDQYVGLQFEQQKLIERTFQEVCERADTTSAHLSL